jgi:hypothetical protein
VCAGFWAFDSRRNERGGLSCSLRQDVLEIRRELAKLGYLLKQLYREGRDGLIFCASYELAGSSEDVEQVVAYVRVSMYQQSGDHSLVTQLTQMLSLAEECDQLASHVYVEAGVSGADSGRSAFQAIRNGIYGCQGLHRQAGR